MTSTVNLARMLIEELSRNPNLSAIQLSEFLNVDRTLITRVLWTHNQTFVHTGTTPPIWRLLEGGDMNPVDEAPPSPVIQRAPAAVERKRLFLPSEMSLYKWQIEALEAWRANGNKGIVEAVTGAGKTMVGLAAINEKLKAGGRVVVVVPTIELARQWRGILEGRYPLTRIGQMGGGESDSLENCDVLIAVLGSARRYTFDLGNRSGLLVADECHRYGAEISKRALEEVFDERLGLSATYHRSDGAHETVLEPYFDGVVMVLGYRRAIDDGVVARFRVGLVSVEISPAERMQYDSLSEQVRKARSNLVTQFGVPREPFDEFLKAVMWLKRHGGIREGIAANRFWKAFTERRTLLAETPAKMAVLDALGPSILDSNRTILFTQTIESAIATVARLRSLGIVAGCVHSGLAADERRAVLSRFASGGLKAVVAPKVLDEGVDVPEADLAIILAASQQRRQMVQRMGRVLRIKADGRKARFAIAYVAGTSEDPEQGAHEAFLSDVIEVADDVRLFSANSAPSTIRNYLSPTST